MSNFIVGGGGAGKAGGGGGGISEDPDTLVSVQQARFIDLISEGEIVGLVNGDRSIYLDGVPLRSLEGTPNYKPFTFDWRPGTQGQTVINGFMGTQSENAVGLRVSVLTGMIIRPIADSGADSVRVTVSVQGLTSTSDEGRISGTSVTYAVKARQAPSGVWRTLKEVTISGKTGSKYQRSSEFLLSPLGSGPYEVAIERITPDSASALLVNDIFWDSYTVINFEKFSYPNSALVAVGVDARYFSNVPERKYHVRGLIMRVPMNYDTLTRTYATTGPGTTAGAWDGTFKLAYTNNPAWCYYDIVTSGRYGLGRRLGANALSKWDLYTIGQYCDGLVPTGQNESTQSATDRERQGFDGRGQGIAAIPLPNNNMEPRFTLNCVINTRTEAYRLLALLSSVFRGMTYWSTGLVSATQDRPTSPSMVFNNTNVKDGHFSYQGSSRSQRNTVVTVGWNDPAEDFKQKFEYCEDKDGIARYGVREESIVAFGCTSRGQARRAGLWYLLTQRLESDMVTWSASRDASFLRPGDTVLVHDTHRVGARMGGRISAATTTAITVDKAITLAAGVYTLSAVLPTGGVESRTVTIGSGGSFTVLTVGTAFSAAPPVQGLWTLSSVVVSELKARIVNLRHVDKAWIEITAVQNVDSKYEAVDLGAPLTLPNYSLLTTKSIPDVAGLRATENSYKPTLTAQVRSDLNISWDATNNSIVRGYMVRVMDSLDVSSVVEVRNPYRNLGDVQPGEFRIEVACVTHLGTVGNYSVIDKIVTGIDSTPPSDVTNFTYSIEPTIGVRLKWTDVPDYIDFYEIRKGSTWETAVPVATTKSNQHPVGLVTGAVTYLLKAVDTGGNPSTNAASLFVDVPRPNAVSASYTISGVNEVLSWLVPSSVIAIDRYIVKYGTDFETGTLVDSTKATSLTRKVDYVGARMYWIAAVDAAGGVGTPTALSSNIVAPSEVTSPRAEVVDNNVLLFWGVPSVHTLPIDRYEVRKGATWASGSTVGSNADSTFCSVFEQESNTYTYWITAFDSANNQGIPIGITAKVNQPPDYTLRTNIDSTFTGTKTNMVVEGATLVGPFDTSETWESHFTSRSWADPQAQINAGYPIYLQPSTTSGSYDESFDAGAVLPATTIVATLGSTLITGSVTVACQIYYKLNVGDGWTAATAGATSVLTSNFRYYRVVWTFTCTAGANLIQVNSFNVKLSAKQKNDSGTFTISNATNGVVVTFNQSFVDADTPVVQPAGLTPLIPVVDFSDTPNPTQFTVYLYNTSGVKVTGSGSWQVRGY